MHNRDSATRLDWRKVNLLHLCIMSALVCGCAGEEPQQSQEAHAPWGEEKAAERHLQDLVANAFTLQTLEALLVSSGLASEMASPPYTMFMPWDNAFRRMPAFWARAKSDPRWRAHLRSIADAHLHQGLATTGEGENVTLAMLDGSDAAFSQQNSRHTLDGILVIAETAALDGHAYMIDEVRMPSWTQRTAWDIIDADPRFSILKGILSADARTHLDQTEATTLFAPTNAAFGGDEAWAQESGLDIGNLIVDQVMSKRWTPGGRYTTRSGATLAWESGAVDAPRTVTCTLDSGEPLAPVTVGAKQELANNGVVHPMDELPCMSSHTAPVHCEVACAEGSVRSPECEASIVTPDVAACNVERQACCELTGAPIVLQPPKPPADAPCYDYCGEGSRMLGSKVVPAALLPQDWKQDATCWEYAIANEADTTACTQPDEHIRAHCCYPDDDPVTSTGIGNYCCLCDGCYGADSSRFEHVVTSSRDSCVAIDFKMTTEMDLTPSSPDREANRQACLGMRSAFESTCCGPDMGTDANGADVPLPPSLAPEVYEPEPYFCDSRGQFPFCSLCKNGSFPTSPYTVATIAGVPGNPTCADLYMMGITNNLPASLCYPIQNFMEEPCGCEPEAAPGPLCPDP